ncbi:HD domain-containing protein [Pedobacter caeni]|uniref:Guanosine-3',5'-bis(Diphosphate) 3'-pyrophosphohydrolase n=1 Tax=Pedobacter caeni TaxID=288992 RepID=A0A1M4WGE9_9SPHI|nr:HD domain-containing protein [Pedobacter caeni]SHE80257.1 guanosine-3',5'-bis(diphosphate) 3'-pyrophosphohydrolase [Pedobacter caeni]
MEIQSIYQETIKFATAKHLSQNQTIPGTNLPYVVHLSNVAMEILIASQHSPGFKLDFAIKLALLHDTLEDTDTTFEEISNVFGLDVAEGVLALTKDSKLPKAEKMPDSLARIKNLQKEVWAVKLADRITNLQVPPSHWDTAKKTAYRNEAIRLSEELKGGNGYLENRLQEKIVAYEKYISIPT